MKANLTGNIFRKKCSRSVLEVQSRHFTGETEKSHENTHAT